MPPISGNDFISPFAALIIPRIASPVINKFPRVNIKNQPKTGMIDPTILIAIAARKSTSPWFAWNMANFESLAAKSGIKKIM